MVFDRWTWRIWSRYGADLIDMADVVAVDNIEVSRGVGMLPHQPQAGSQHRG